MRWLFIIDPIEKMNPKTDTTYALMEESHSRNISCFIADVNDLFFDKKAGVNASEITFKNSALKSGNKNSFELDDFGLIFMRKEPPYNLAFHYATCLLSLCKKPVVNSPRALRDFNEKLIALNFPSLMPKTFVSADEKKLLNFINENNHVVLKSLDSYQGKSVSEAHKNDSNIKQTISKLTIKGTVQIMAQEFLENVHEGDKRILMLNGKIIGSVNRIPKQGSFVSNFGQGGKGAKTEITPNDKIIADAVSGFLVRNGIHFAGLDVIGKYLTEINITCPTGLKQINALENRHLEKEIIDYFERIAKT